MRTLKLILCVLSVIFLAMPALAAECANAGAAPTVAPDDTGDGNATACGGEAVAGGEASVALGNAASSAGDNSTALGNGASSAGLRSVALGWGATSTAENSIASGYQASSAGESSTALGRSATAGGIRSTALGRGASATADYSTALGHLSSATGLVSIALGAGASSVGSDSTALGTSASSAGANSIALGTGASSVGARSAALGYLAFADQPDTVILGSIAGKNFANTYASIGIGTSAPSQAVDVERSEAAARFQLTSFTDTADQAPQYIQRRARGTRTAPTAVLNNDNLGLFSFRGYNGTNMGGSRATITAQAAGDFTGTSTPTRLIFATTPVDSTTPQQVLVITHDGKVQISGVNLNVPDFVFEDDYPLMPLEQLRSFIDTHGHLPGIASADEVQSEGLDLAGSQMGLLQKVEELTLYALQQEARLAEQESRLEAQQELIENLRVPSNDKDHDTGPATLDMHSAASGPIQALEARNRELEARIAHMEELLKGLLPQVTQN